MFSVCPNPGCKASIEFHTTDADGGTISDHPVGGIEEQPQCPLSGKNVIQVLNELQCTGA